MNVEAIQNRINALEYWDARVLSFECNYFGDEVAMTFGELDRIDEIKFEGCYKIVIDHDKTYDKGGPAKDLKFPEIPYFLHDINVSLLDGEGRKMYKTKIVMYPLEIEIHSDNVIA